VPVAGAVVVGAVAASSATPQRQLSNGSATHVRVERNTV
jgi:hypothetical protein